MPRSLSRRSFLFTSLGASALILPACTTRSQARPGGMPKALPPTPQIVDDDAPTTPFPTAPVCEATADNIEGPFYKAGAPSRARFVADRDAGERLVLAGTVRGTTCDPLANATLDIWHADARGGYDNDGWGLRGTLVSDALGRFRLDTIVPGRYLNGKRYRPSHIHVKVRAKGYQELTTQLYFEGDPYIEGDPFVVSSLIMAHRKDGSARRAMFDFVV
jgi:protocatechuate 3,4-dioxygenase beta subunit